MNKVLLDGILSRGLDLLDHFHSVNVVINRYPAVADLRSLLDVALQVSSFYARVPEPPGQLQAGRERFLMAAAEQRSRVEARPQRASQRPGKKPSGPWRRFSWKWAGAVLAILLAFMPLTNQVTWAATESIPGNPFYAFKLANEDHYLDHIENPEVKTMLSLSMANERLWEIQELVARDRDVPWRVLARMQHLTTLALTSSAWVPETVMSSMLDYVVQHTREQVRTLDALKVTATGDTYKLLCEVENVYFEQGSVALMALANPAAFRVAYQVGKPEMMDFSMGGPLGGTVTPEVIEILSTPVASPTPASPYITTPSAPGATEVMTAVPTDVPEEVLTSIVTATVEVSTTLPMLPTMAPTATPVPPTTITPVPPQPTTIAVNPTSLPDEGGRFDTPPGLEDKEELPPGQENRPSNEDKDKDEDEDEDEDEDKDKGKDKDK
ncbi:MAG: hypothetical protein JXA33_19125 [Anaerolineae bacterium]|nr:hypothetical protein [Anaerolineae bacterium]